MHRRFALPLSTVLSVLFLFSLLLSPTLRADSDLEEAIADFEAMGGTGTWFDSTLPERLGGGAGKFYVVKSIPSKPSRHAKIWILRTESTRGALADVVGREKAPTVFGNIPEQSQVFAAALGGFQLATDTVRVAGVSNHKHIILITPQVSVFTLAHENRHWLDYEDSRLMQDLQDRISGFVDSENLNKEFAALLVQITIEIRGHIVQARQATKSFEAGWPYVDRGGNIKTGSKEELKPYYDFEKMMARQYFEQAYLPYLNEIFSSLTPAQKSALLDILGRYDSSNDPKNDLTYRKVLRVR